MRTEHEKQANRAGPPPIDYAVREEVEVARVDELVEVFADRAGRGEPLRLVGGGSAQPRLPAPARGPVTLVRLAGLTGIERLEADDLTCSVRPGTTRAELDAALAERGVYLPCHRDGAARTLGGLFGADLHAPAAPGALSPRGLLLGLEGVLTDGTRFKSGARVVKSVAGFDLQKLFVGSRGRLFAATLLHLKLRPRPRAAFAFATKPTDADAALTLFDALRLGATPPQELWLTRDDAGGGHVVRGVLTGHPGHLANLRQAHALPESAATEPADAADHGETLQGLVRPSQLRVLLDLLPHDTSVQIGGTGQFEVSALAPAQTDELLRRCAELPAPAEIRAGAVDRRGTATPLDAGAARLAAGLEQALDPRGVLQ